MKDTTIFLLVVLGLLIAAGAAGYVVVTSVGSTGPQFAQSETEAAELESESMRRNASESYTAARAEEERPKAGPGELQHLSIRLSKGPEVVRAALYHSENAENPLVLDETIDSMVVQYTDSTTRELDLYEFFELDELKLNPGERSFPADVSIPGDARPVLGVRFTRQREGEMPLEIFEALPQG